MRLILGRSASARDVDSARARSIALAAHASSRAQRRPRPARRLAARPRGRNRARRGRRLRDHVATRSSSAAQRSSATCCGASRSPPTAPPARSARAWAPVDTHGGATYAVLDLRAACAGAPRQLRVEYGLLFDVDGAHRSLVQIGSGAAATTAVLSAQHPSLEVEVAKLSAWSGLGRFVAEGVWHIWHGYDHLAFVLLLLVPIVLGPRGARELGARAAVGEILRVVTAFTLAHSITLALATLGVVNVPSRLIESLIALSVLIAAVLERRAESAAARCAARVLLRPRARARLCDCAARPRHGRRRDAREPRGVQSGRRGGAARGRERGDAGAVRGAARARLAAGAEVVVLDGLRRARGGVDRAAAAEVTRGARPARATRVCAPLLSAASCAAGCSPA